MQAAAAPAAAIKKGLLDNYDDAEGYYNFQVGEVLNDRYEVRRAVGGRPHCLASWRPG